MFIPDEYTAPETVSMFTLEKLETMVRVCSLEDKQSLLERLSKMVYEHEAQEMINELWAYLPVPGRETTPHTIEQQGVAIRRAVDLDDFYESRKAK